MVELSAIRLLSSVNVQTLLPLFRLIVELLISKVDAPLVVKLRTEIPLPLVLKVAPLPTTMTVRFTAPTIGDNTLNVPFKNCKLPRIPRLTPLISTSYVSVPCIIIPDKDEPEILSIFAAKLKSPLTLSVE